MKNELIPFSFENREVRVLNLDGEPWWVAKDVATVLGFTNPRKAIKDHCDGVTNRYPIVDSLGRTQEVRIIQEADVFRLIVGSKLPSARRFEKWLFETVLPTIRRTGAYIPEGEAQVNKAEFDALCERVKSIETRRLTEVGEGWFAELLIESLERKIRRLETARIMTDSDKLDILNLYVRKYPLAKIHVVTKKSVRAIRKFLDEIMSLDDAARDAEIERLAKSERKEAA